MSLFIKAAVRTAESLPIFHRRPKNPCFLKSTSHHFLLAESFPLSSTHLLYCTVLTAHLIYKLFAGVGSLFLVSLRKKKSIIIFKHNVTQVTWEKTRLSGFKNSTINYLSQERSPPLTDQCLGFTGIWWWACILQTPHLTLPFQAQRRTYSVVQCGSLPHL